MIHKRPYAPTEPFTINPDDSVADVLAKMQKISFQGRSLGEAFDIWQQKSVSIEEVCDLQSLVGECLINDELVEAVIAGCRSTGLRIEPFYNPRWNNE